MDYKDKNITHFKVLSQQFIQNFRKDISNTNNHNDDILTNSLNK